MSKVKIRCMLAGLCALGVASGAIVTNADAFPIHPAQAVDAEDNSHADRQNHLRRDHFQGKFLKIKSENSGLKKIAAQGRKTERSSQKAAPRARTTKRTANPYCEYIQSGEKAFRGGFAGLILSGRSFCY